VATSIINGSIVMQNRRLNTIDREQIMHEVGRIAKLIREV
jgi:hypothetical protein